MPLNKELERNEDYISNLAKTKLEGSTGEIFIAKISNTGEEVIVKEISYEDSNKRDMIISREVAILSNLKHDNIVKFHGYTVKEDCVRIVIEYLSGGDLETAYKKGLSEKQKVRILLQVANGLKYAHEKFLIHRDIKPQNILLNKDISIAGLEFTVKIADFGVSRVGENSTKITGIAGTCAYKAPEHLSGDECDQKIDIYSFSIMAHEILTGRAPYSDETNSKFNQVRLSKSIKSGLRPDKNIPFPEECNKDLIEMIKRNWDKNPDNRMNSNELVENLQKIYDSI